LHKAAAVNVLLALIISPVSLDPLQLNQSQGPTRWVIAGISGDFASTSHLYWTVYLYEYQLVADELTACERHVFVGCILADC
jgi:hypothetical protein